MHPFLLHRPPLSPFDSRLAALQARATWQRESAEGIAERETPPIQEQVDTLRRELNELALFARTAATLLIERGVCTDEEFVEKMLAIDRSDGVQDGQLTPP